MTPRQIRRLRASERFMPRLRAFAQPMKGRTFYRARLLAYYAWGFAWRVRMQLVED